VDDEEDFLFLLYIRISVVFWINIHSPLSFKHVHIESCWVHPDSPSCPLTIRYEYSDIVCGTHHVHVLWHNLCVYEQVASPQWHRWSTRTNETFAIVSTSWKCHDIVSPVTLFRVLWRIHPSPWFIMTTFCVFSFDRIFVCGYVISWCMCVCMLTTLSLTTLSFWRVEKIWILCVGTIINIFFFYAEAGQDFLILLYKDLDCFFG
jgi:hypothetical protein